MPRAHDLIKAELEATKDDLTAKLVKLAIAQQDVIVLHEICERLRQRIVDLERDREALDRGYIALMCDKAG